MSYTAATALSVGGSYPAPRIARELGTAHPSSILHRVTDAKAEVLVPSRPASQREVLRRIIAAKRKVVSTELPPPWSNALAELHTRFNDPAPSLRVTRRSRSLSEFRYHNAEHFFRGFDGSLPYTHRELFYRGGIVTQLAISSHLLDIGFPDEWCARNIGLRVAHSLAYANATGFDHHCPQMARLAAVLNPYWKWNDARRGDKPEPDDGGFSVAQIAVLLRALLDHVHHVTGHDRPGGGEGES